MNTHRIQRPIHPGEVAPTRQVGQQPKAPEETFDNVLRSKLAEPVAPVKFSAHATERLASRNILLTEQDVAKLGSAVQKMEEKGGKESLMLMGDLALVVSVKNRTVITAVDHHAATNEKIFTNIDSALILK